MTTFDILAVSNLWPPHFVGGYELGAAEIVEHLIARGHRVAVLTSTFGVPGRRTEGTVHRLIREPMFSQDASLRGLLGDAGRRVRDARRLRQFVRSRRVDVVLLFNPHGLATPFVSWLCREGSRVLALVSDPWVSAWPWCDPLLRRWYAPRVARTRWHAAGFRVARRTARVAGALSPLDAGVPRTHMAFVSRYVRDISVRRGSPLSADVIPWGVDLRRYPYRERGDAELHAWAYVGQIAEHKGPQTAIEAVERLRRAGHPVRLRLFGDARGAWARALRARVERAGLGGAIQFLGAHPRTDLPAEAYAPAGLLVFPSLWDEPFSLTLLEAFASGLPVLTTTTGGTGELARHGETASVFGAGDATDLAARWGELARHPERARAMARRARAIVERHLGIEAMVDRVEAALRRVATGAPGPGAPGHDAGAERHPWEAEPSGPA